MHRAEQVGRLDAALLDLPQQPVAVLRGIGLGLEPGVARRIALLQIGEQIQAAAGRALGPGLPGRESQRKQESSKQQKAQGGHKIEQRQRALLGDVGQAMHGGFTNRQSRQNC
jgi:hypothetical protein